MSGIVRKLFNNELPQIFADLLKLFNIELFEISRAIYVL